MFDQGRFVRVVLLGLLVSFGAGWLPKIALAEQGYPDFYGTIIAVDRDRAIRDRVVGKCPSHDVRRRDRASVVREGHRAGVR